MKVRLLLLACLVTVTIAGGVERSCDELKARLNSGLQYLPLDSPAGLLTHALSVRSCDADDDGALNSVEFADCLQRMTDHQNKLSADTQHQRAGCFQRFMKEADEDLDDLVSSAELGRWSARLDSRVSSGADVSTFTGRFSPRHILDLCVRNNCIRCEYKETCKSDDQCPDGTNCFLKRCCMDREKECVGGFDCKN